MPIEVDLSLDGVLAFDTDGEYLTLFLDEPNKDVNGRWFVENPERLLIIQKIQNPLVIFKLGNNELKAGEKIKFINLVFEDK